MACVAPPGTMYHMCDGSSVPQKWCQVFVSFPACIGSPFSDADKVMFNVKHAFFYRECASNTMHGWCISVHPESWQNWSLGLKKECSFEPYTGNIVDDHRYMQNAKSLQHFALVYKPQTTISAKKQALPSSVLSYASERLWHSKQDVHAVINIWAHETPKTASGDLVLLKVVNYPLFLTVVVSLSSAIVSRHLLDLTAFLNREIHNKYQKDTSGVEALSKGLYVRSKPVLAVVCIWTRIIF